MAQTPSLSMQKASKGVIYIRIEIIGKGNILKKAILIYDPEIIYFEIRTWGRYFTMSTALRNAEISHQ